MRLDRCQSEEELLEALGRGFVSAELEGHLAFCAACSELRMLAGALLDDRAQAIAEATVVPSGTMWWRMRVRHRQEVEATARRSLLIGQGMTLAVAITMVILFFGTDLAFAVRQGIATIRISTPLLLALASWLLAAPVAGWVAIRQK